MNSYELDSFSRCPACQSADSEIIAVEEADGSKCLLIMGCTDCDERWSEEYRPMITVQPGQGLDGELPHPNLVADFLDNDGDGCLFQCCNSDGIAVNDIELMPEATAYISSDSSFNQRCCHVPVKCRCCNRNWVEVYRFYRISGRGYPPNENTKSMNAAIEKENLTQLKPVQISLLLKGGG